ncbi:hypothetical protein VCV18_004305 [Metarhizium anisopliae]
MPTHRITSFGEVWGAGWAESDNGQREALKNEVRGCALFPAPGSKLEYAQNLENNDKHGDGREWTAYFHTGMIPSVLPATLTGAALAVAPKYFVSE